MMKPSLRRWRLRRRRRQRNEYDLILLFNLNCPITALSTNEQPFRQMGECGSICVIRKTYSYKHNFINIWMFQWKLHKIMITNRIVCNNTVIFFFWHWKLFAIFCDFKTWEKQEIRKQKHHFCEFLSLVKSKGFTLLSPLIIKARRVLIPSGIMCRTTPMSKKLTGLCLFSQFEEWGMWLSRKRDTSVGFTCDRNSGRKG